MSSVVHNLLSNNGLYLPNQISNSNSDRQVLNNSSSDDSLRIYYEEGTVVASTLGLDSVLFSNFSVSIGQKRKADPTDSSLGWVQRFELVVRQRTALRQGHHTTSDPLKLHSLFLDL